MQFVIRCLENTSSTNDDAKHAAEVGVAEGLVIWALEQKGGRGRQGRHWYSPPGNLYFSVLLRPPLPKRDYGYFSFVAGLAVREVVSDLLQKSTVELKWPNDVLVKGKKISGILLEAGEGWLVIGIGLNVYHAPENTTYSVTSLMAEGGGELALETILQKVLKVLARWYACLNSEGFAPIRTAWLEHARTGTMRARLPSGEIIGQFSDIDEKGNLTLVLEGGERKTINAADIFCD